MPTKSKTMAVLFVHGVESIVLLDYPAVTVSY